MGYFEGPVVAIMRENTRSEMVKKGRNMINRAAYETQASPCVIPSIWQIVSTLWPERPAETLMMLAQH